MTVRDARGASHTRRLLVRFTPVSMLQWIAKLFSFARSEACCCEMLACVPREKAISRDGLRAEVLEFSLPCGHVGYGIEIARLDEDGKSWFPIARIYDYEMHQAIGLLCDAAKHLDSRTMNESKTERQDVE